MGCAMATSSRGSAAFYSRYSLGEKISQGHFSQVHIATAKGKPSSSAGREVSVKIMSYFDVSEKSHLDEVRMKAAGREVTLWSGMQDHDNVLRFGEAFFDNHLCYIVTEKCSKTLFGYLETQPSITEASLWKVFAQMLRAISHLHSADIVHCDIRPEKFEVGGADGHTVKLLDFGLALKLTKNGIGQGAHGGSLYMSPEMKESRFFTHKTDIWSFGVIAYLLLCGTFPGVNQLSLTTTKADLLDPPDFSHSWLSTNAICFLKMVLCSDSKQRPTAKIALNLLLMKASDNDRDLPCLQPMVNAAAKLVAAQKPRPRVTAIDMVLDALCNEFRFSKQPAKVRPAELYVEEPESVPKIHMKQPLEVDPSDISTCSGNSWATRNSALMTSPAATPRDSKLIDNL